MIGLLIVAAAVATSQLGAVWFLVLVGILVLSAAFELARIFARGGLGVQPPYVGIVSLVFPLAAFRWGERGLMLGAAAAMILVAAPAVLRGQRPGAIDALAASLFTVMYVGFLSSYAVLVRGAGRGRQLLLALSAMVALYHLGRWFGTSRLGRRLESPAGWVPSLRGAVLGVAGSLLGALGSVLVLRAPFDLAPMLGLGLSTGVASTVGSLSGALVRTDLKLGALEATVPGYGGIVARLEAVLFAAPAFFYGFRLYLT